MAKVYMEEYLRLGSGPGTALDWCGAFNRPADAIKAFQKEVLGEMEASEDARRWSLGRSAIIRDADSGQMLYALYVTSPPASSMTVVCVNLQTGKLSTKSQP